jgi:hypothetical protein
MSFGTTARAFCRPAPDCWLLLEPADPSTTTFPAAALFFAESGDPFGLSVRYKRTFIVRETFCMPGTAFTDAELRAYLDERLPVARSTELESALRARPALAQRLRQLLGETERTDLSLEAVWRRLHLSCPSRSTWALYLSGELGDGLKQYLEFHLQTIGCRYCAANVEDLRRGADADAQPRARRVFESSIGQLHALP